MRAQIELAFLSPRSSSLCCFGFPFAHNCSLFSYLSGTLSYLHVSSFDLDSLSFGHRYHLSSIEPYSLNYYGNPERHLLTARILAVQNFVHSLRYLQPRLWGCIMRACERGKNSQKPPQDYLSTAQFRRETLHVISMLSSIARIFALFPFLPQLQNPYCEKLEAND